jgi:2-oxoglutarate ferredoxin oxidoreductase subunit alpha
LDYNILIGGAAGQGMDTLGHMLSKALKNLGFYVFLHKDYMSRIRGGHNYIKIRFSNNPIFSHADELTLIIALNYETARIHSGNLAQSGKIIAVEDADKINGEHAPVTINLPVKDIIQKTGNRRVIGTAALGCALKLFGLPVSPLIEEAGELFEEQILEANKIAAQEGYNAHDTIFNAELPHASDSIFINGNESIALGALAAGCKFYSAYPMTPATSIMTYLSKKSKKAAIIVEQAEDEIAAINMALGASYAGLRSMTGSSGGGFALMVEGVSLAGITETPIVIAISQRPGPATGFPTRTEQGDLGFVLHSGHGEFPRMVIALRHPEDAFYQTVRAFNIADKYQIPVFLLTDQYLADYTATVKPFDFSKVLIERHLTEDLSGVEYKRYAITESGISPRTIPGKIPGQIVKLDSDEHDESGHITESAQVRNAMVNKRFRKVKPLYDELIEPEYIGCENPNLLIICWGSTYGPVKEAISELNLSDYSIGALIFGDIYPLPTKALTRLAKTATKIINLEQNATGQLAALVKQQAIIACDHSLLKYDGRQWSKDEIINALKKEVL